jgi:Retroviral aspartyl protease
MRINGFWAVCDDGVVRPVIRGEIQAGDGSWVVAEFLADTGADRTVICGAVLAKLGLPSLAAPQLGGVGGAATTVQIDTSVRMKESGGAKVIFRGRFAVFPDLAALDMSVLGRDISNLFAVIADRPGDTVCLLNAPHAYTISPP